MKSLTTQACKGFLLFLLFIKFHSFLSPCFSQGVLSRVSNKVQKTERQPEQPREEKETKKSNSILGSVVNSVLKSDSRDRPQKQRPSSRSRRSRSRRRGYRPSQPSVFIYEQVHYSPPVANNYAVIPAPVAPIAPQVNPIVEPVLDRPIVEEHVDNNVYESSIVDELHNDFQNWSMRLTAFYGSNFDRLNHGGLSLLIQETGGLGIDASVTTFRESSPSVRNHIWLGDANIVLEGITGDLRGRVGLGVNWLADSVGADAGFNLTFGLDVKISDRLIGSGEIDFGSLGATDLFHTQVSLGYRIQKSEIVTGYDYYNIGGTGIDGWFLGFRIRY